MKEALSNQTPQQKYERTEGSAYWFLPSGVAIGLTAILIEAAGKNHAVSRGAGIIAITLITQGVRKYREASKILRENPDIRIPVER